MSTLQIRDPFAIEWLLKNVRFKIFLIDWFKIVVAYIVSWLLMKHGISVIGGNHNQTPKPNKGSPETLIITSQLKSIITSKVLHVTIYKDIIKIIEQIIAITRMLPIVLNVID